MGGNVSNRVTSGLYNYLYNCRFFYDFMTRTLKEIATFFACYLLFLCSTLASNMWSHTKLNDSAETNFLTMIENFSALLLSQNMTRTITGYLDAESGIHASVSGMRLVAGVSMLLNVAILPEYVLQKQFTQTSISLLLYILTDSSSSSFSDIDRPWNPRRGCVLVYLRDVADCNEVPRRAG